MIALDLDFMRRYLVEMLVKRGHRSEVHQHGEKLYIAVRHANCYTFKIRPVSYYNRAMGVKA